MGTNDHSPYEIGYKKPPHNTRFKAGQSGNPKGRPKRVTTLAKALEKELLALVTMVEEGGKRRKISKLEAILKQHINNAAKGDLKAAALVLSLLKAQQPDASDNLGALLQVFRAKHARDVAGENKDQMPDKNESNNEGE